jgi:hypothetical protein
MLAREQKPSRKTLRLAGGVSALVIAVAAMPGKAFAATCGKQETFFSWGCTTADGEQITPVLIKILNWLAIGVTIAVIGGIIYGAVMYTTSGGNQAQAQKAIGIIRNAVIALILYFAMWALLNFLVPGGLFSS